jgi:hypothetical protein
VTAAGLVFFRGGVLAGGAESSLLMSITSSSLVDAIRRFFPLRAPLETEEEKKKKNKKIFIEIKR